MAAFESLSAFLATKLGAAAAGVALTSATVGVAAATGTLPDEAADAATVAEERGDADLDTLVVEGEVETETHEQGELHRSDVADAVLEVITGRDGYETGREFGEAVSSAAREANGSGEAGQAEERRAEAEQRRADAQERATAGRDNAPAPADQGADNADEGAGNADVADEHRDTTGEDVETDENAEGGLGTAEDARSADRP